MRALPLTGLLVLTTSLALPAGTARAASVTGQGATVRFEAGPGERNTVRVVRSGASSLRITDRVGISAGAGCTQSGAAVVCPVRPNLVVALGDQNDRVEVVRALVLQTRLLGGPGNDVLIGGGGPDVFEGGPGSDITSYASRADGVLVSLNGAPDDGAPGEADDVGTEQVQGTAAIDTLTGGAGADRLEGRGGDDRIDGGAGNDSLVGGAGDDAVAGGPGNDQLLASAAADGTDVLAGGEGSDRADYGLRPTGLVADADGRPDDGTRPGGMLSAVGPVPAIALLAAPERDNVLHDVESIRGGRGDDVLVAGPSGGSIEGMDGTDVVGGGPGTDQLSGGNGFDRLLARDRRRDRLACGAAVDRVFVDGSDRPPADCESTSTTFAVGLSAQRRRAAGGGPAIRVACPAQAYVRCVGAVRVVTVRRLRRASGRRREATLGAGRFNAQPGTSVDVRVRLSPSGRAVLRRLGGSTRVRAVARGRDEAGPARSAATRFLLSG